MPISSIDDCNKLQYDLIQFSLWRLNNDLNLNSDKCIQISFTTNRQNLNLFIIQITKNLELIFLVTLKFSEHVNEINNKAIRVLGFLQRNCREFRDPNWLHILYFFLVQSIREYGSII